MNCLEDVFSNQNEKRWKADRAFKKQALKSLKRSGPRKGDRFMRFCFLLDLAIFAVFFALCAYAAWLYFSKSGAWLDVMPGAAAALLGGVLVRILGKYTLALEESSKRREKAKISDSRIVYSFSDKSPSLGYAVFQISAKKDGVSAVYDKKSKMVSVSGDIVFSVFGGGKVIRSERLEKYSFLNVFGDDFAEEIKNFIFKHDGKKKRS